MIFYGNPEGEEIIRVVCNKTLRSSFASENVPTAFSKKTGEMVKAFHNSFPQYKPTPLVNLKSQAKHIGVSQVLVKDESYRFGLKAFKILGGSFAIGKLLARKLGVDFNTVGYNFLKSTRVIEKIGVLTFVTASDGNHGLGVAWTAKQLGHKAVIFLPGGTVENRVKTIEKTGAEVIVTAFDYDRTVELAKETAREKGWELIQDTAFKNYREIPEWIMQGYTTMVYEAIEQIKHIDVEKPTHLFLQAGVGSMAASVLGYFVNEFTESYPLTAIIEPHQAACFYDSVVIGDGQPHPAKGNLKTIMAGLSCGVPSTVAWDILKNYSDMMISCPDHIATEGMRIFARPLGSDEKIISGESGAIGIGLLSAIMKDERNVKVGKRLNLDKDSIVLLFNTEGDTDPENYRKIVDN